MAARMLGLWIDPLETAPSLTRCIAGQFEHPPRVRRPFDTTV